MFQLLIKVLQKACLLLKQSKMAVMVLGTMKQTRGLYRAFTLLFKFDKDNNQSSYKDKRGYSCNENK